MQLLPRFSLLALVLVNSLSFTAVFSQAGDFEEWFEKSGRSNIEGIQTDGIPCLPGMANCPYLADGSNAAINRQISELINFSYRYQALANYFNREDVALRGLANLFHSNVQNKFNMANSMMDYLAERGGTLELRKISQPTTTSWDSAVEAVRDGLEIEQEIQRQMINLHWLASDKGDTPLADYIDEKFTTDTMNNVYKMSYYTTTLAMFKGDMVGVFNFDHQLFEDQSAFGAQMLIPGN